MRKTANLVPERLRAGFCAAVLIIAIAAALPIAGGDIGAAGAADPADLSLSKSDSPDPVGVGNVLTYTLRIQNAGPDPATGVVVTDSLPSQVDPQTAQASVGDCKLKGRKVNCELGTIADGATATVTIRVRPKKAGQITNTGSVKSDVTDPQNANDSDSEATTVVQPPRPTCRKQPATITGTAAGETLNGTAGKDVIVARGGDDQIKARGGNDVICAGRGNDVVRAGAGDDLAKGGAGRDRLRGKSGDDTLRGNRGRDRLRGGSGRDLLAGGKGRDRCKGGSGRDRLRSC